MKTDELICMMAKTPPCCTHKRNIRIWSLVGALLLALTAIVWGTLGFRTNLVDMIHSPEMMFKYATIAAATAGTGLAWWYSGHPNKNWKIYYYGLIFLAGLVAAKTLYAIMYPAMPLMPEVFNRNAIFCVGFLSGFSVLGSAVLARISGCMAPTNCRVHATMTALFAAFLGAFAFSMHCPQDHPAYLMLWYGGTMAVYSLIAVPVLMKKQAW